MAAQSGEPAEADDVAEQAAETDLSWAVDEDIPPGPYPRDSRFVFRRVPEVVTDAATSGIGGRVLDVACGLGGQLTQLKAKPRWQAWGLDTSMALLGHCRKVFADEGGVPLVCATAEALPFRANSFDRIVCQGSIDHFTAPSAFMAEVARILKPDGHAVIGISNYDSLSCRVGKWLHGFKDARGIDVYRGRNYWEIPPNHTFRGTYSVLRRLGEPYLDLIECRGVSLMWMFRRWTQLMEALPAGLAWSLLTIADRIADRVPAIADLNVFVWRPRSEIGG